MIVLVAIKEDDKIFVGADRQSTAGQIIEMKKEPKFMEKTFNVVDGYGKKIRESKLLLGVTGCAYLGTFLRYGFNFPDLNDNIEDFEEYLIKSLFPTLKKKLVENKLVAVSNNKLNTESAFLIIYNGEMYCIETNLGVISIGGSYTAMGSGAQIALGSLHTSEDLGFTSKQRIGLALEAAADNTIYVSHEYDIFEIENDEIKEDK